MEPTIKELKEDHHSIEQDLIEIEGMMADEVINHSNLAHVLNELHTFLEEHENKEDYIFGNLRKKGFTIPVKRISFEHGVLKKDIKSLINALHSGSEFKTKQALLQAGKDMANRLREHMKKEDWILYALPENIA